MKFYKLILLSSIFLLTLPAYADIERGTMSSIATEDGTTRVYPYEIKVPNTALSDNSDGTASISTSVGDAPSTADYLVGTTQSGLSAEIVVGTTPGGSLGGTWGSPTVDDDSHAHTGSTLSSIDISADTNLAGTANQIILTDDTLSAPQDIHTSATPQFARLGLGTTAHATNLLQLSADGIIGTTGGLTIDLVAGTDKDLTLQNSGAGLARLLIDGGIIVNKDITTATNLKNSVLLAGIGVSTYDTVWGTSGVINTYTTTGNIGYANIYFRSDYTGTIPNYAHEMFNFSVDHSGILDSSLVTQNDYIRGINGTAYFTGTVNDTDENIYVYGCDLTGTFSGGTITAAGTVEAYGGKFTATGISGVDTAYGIYAAASGATTNYAGYFSGDVYTTTDITVAGSDITVGEAGVKLTGDGDGAITFLGLGDGFDEDLTINLDDTTNRIVLSSSTGADQLNYTNGTDSILLDLINERVTITDGTNTYYYSADFGIMVPSDKAVFVPQVDTDAGWFFMGTGTRRTAGRDLTGTEQFYFALAGEAWLSGGVKLGTDQNANWFDDATHGSSSTTMYIGQNTINTTAPSDIRLKENIKPTQYGLKDILNMPVYDFNFKLDQDKKQNTGMVAQEVQQIMPTLVKERSDGFLMIEYEKLIPVLVKSIQEQNKKIEDLERKLSEKPTTNTIPLIHN